MTEENFNKHIELNKIKNLITGLLKWIKENESVSAEFSNDIRSLSSRFNDLEQTNRKGTLSFEEYTLNKNQIKDSIFYLSSELKGNGFFKEEKKINIDAPIPKTNFKNKLNQFDKPSELFTGRQDKVSEIAQAFSENDIFSITGIGGIGKTQLALKFIASFEEHKSKKITWQDFSESQLFDNFIEAAGFGLIIQSNKTDREKFSAFADKLNEYKRIVILDNFHDSTDKTFLRFLDFVKGKLHAAKIIIISRTNEEISSFKTIELTDFKESAEYVKILLEKRYSTVKLSDDEIHEICKSVKGHPLAIELTLNLCKSMSPKRVIGKLVRHKKGIDKLSQRLFQEILEQNSTTQAEKDFLYEFSIFKGKVPEQEVEDFFGEDCFYEVLPSLQEKYLIEYKEEQYDTHPLIREFCYQKLANKKELHAKAADFLIKQRTDKLDTLLEERIFHHLKGAEEYEKIEQTIEKHGREYFRRAFLEPLQEMIAFARAKNISNPLFDLLEGNIYKLQSEWNKALSYFEKVIENTKDEKLAVEGLLKSGGVYRKKEDNDKALKIYKQAEIISQQKEFEKYIAWSYNGIATVKETFGEYNEAFDLMIKALKISERLKIKEDLK